MYIFFNIWIDLMQFICWIVCFQTALQRRRMPCRCWEPSSFSNTLDAFLKSEAVLLIVKKRATFNLVRYSNNVSATGRHIVA